MGSLGMIGHPVSAPYMSKNEGIISLRQRVGGGLR